MKIMITSPSAGAPAWATILGDISIRSLQATTICLCVRARAFSNTLPISIFLYVSSCDKISYQLLYMFFHPYSLVLSFVSYICAYSMCV